MNEYSPDSSGITEANKAGQDHTFLEAKGTEDKVICQQKLKKTRIQQPMEEIQTVKVEHETMASEDRNKLVDSPNNHHEPSNIISEGISDNGFVPFTVISNINLNSVTCLVFTIFCI